MMFGIVQSEILKFKHTFSMKLILFAPFVTLLLGYFLSGSSIQYAAYNWWCTMIFPMIISIWCTDIIKKENNTEFQNILCLPTDLGKIWIGKNIAIIIFLFVDWLYGIWLFYDSEYYAAKWHCRVHIPFPDKYLASSVYHVPF